MRRLIAFLTLTFFLFSQAASTEAASFSAQSRLKAPSAASASDGAGRSLIDSIRETLTDRKVTTSIRDGGVRAPVMIANLKMEVPDHRMLGRIMRGVVKKAQTQVGRQGTEIIFAVSYPSIPFAVELARKLNQKFPEGPQLKIAAQDLDLIEKGARTGDVSAAMLKNRGVTHVLIGHSERRHGKIELDEPEVKQTDEMLARKLAIAFKYDLVPVYLIGEKKKERNSPLGWRSTIEKQMVAGFISGVLMAREAGDVTDTKLSKVIVGYEPVWAIGKDAERPATPEEAQEVHAYIRLLLNHHLEERGFSEEAASGIRIPYGGSMKPDNVEGLIAMPDVEGGVIGSVSLNPEAFSELVFAAERDYRNRLIEQRSEAGEPIFTVDDLRRVLAETLSIRRHPIKFEDRTGKHPVQFIWKGEPPHAHLVKIHVDEDLIADPIGALKKIHDEWRSRRNDEYRSERYVRAFDVLIETQLAELETARDGSQRVVHYELSPHVGLTVDMKGGIATLSYRRAPFNYLNTEMFKAMTKGILDHVKWNPRIRMLVFDENSAGTDIPEHLAGDVDKVISATSEFFRTLESLAIPKGTLVKPGYLLGGGLEVALMTDVIVAVNSPKTRLGSPEVKLGALAPYAAILLPRRLGAVHADEVMKWLMSGNFYNLEEAKAIGLVDAVGRNEEEARSILIDRLARLSERMPYISRVAESFSDPVPPERFLTAGQKEITKNRKGGIALSKSKERYILPEPILHLFLVAVEAGLKNRDFDTALTRIDELFLETAMKDRHLRRYPELAKAVEERGISPSQDADYGFRYFMAHQTMPTDWRSDTVSPSRDGGEKTQDEEMELVSMGFDLLAPDYDHYDPFLNALAVSLQMDPFQLHERLKALNLGKDDFVSRSPKARARAQQMAHRQTARLSREDDGTVHRTLNPFVDLYAVLDVDPATEHLTKHLISTRYAALVKRADRMRGNVKKQKLGELKLAHDVLVNRHPGITREEYDAQYRKEKGLGEFRIRDGGEKVYDIVEAWDALLTRPLPRAKNRDDLRELQEIRGELVAAEWELHRRLGRLFRRHFWNLDLPISSIAYDEGIDLGEYAAKIQERLEAVDLKIDVIGGKLNKKQRDAVSRKEEPLPKPDKARLRKLLKGSLPTDQAGLEASRAELENAVAIVDAAIGGGIRELWHIGVGREEHQYGEVVGINAAIEGTLEKRHPGLNLKETGDALDARIAEIDTRSRFASDGASRKFSSSERSPERQSRDGGERSVQGNRLTLWKGEQKLGSDPTPEFAVADRLVTAFSGRRHPIWQRFPEVYVIPDVKWKDTGKWEELKAKGAGRAQYVNTMLEYTLVFNGPNAEEAAKAALDYLEAAERAAAGKIGLVSIPGDYHLLPLAEFSQELEKRFGGIDFTQGITPEIASQVDAFLASLDVNDPVLLDQLKLNEEHHSMWGYTRLGLQTPDGKPLMTQNKSVIVWAAGYKPGDYSYPHIHESDKEYVYEAYIPAVGPIRTEEFEVEDRETKRTDALFALRPVRSVIQVPGDGQVYVEPKGSDIHRNGNPGDNVAWLISIYIRDTRPEKRGAALPEFHPLSNEEVAEVALDSAKTWYRIVAQDGQEKMAPVSDRANYLLTHFREHLEARIRGDRHAPPNLDFQMMMQMEQFFSDEPEFNLLLAFGDEAGMQIYHQIVAMRSKAMRLHELVGYDGILDAPVVQETASSILADLEFLAGLQEADSGGKKRFSTSRFSLDQIRSFVHSEEGNRITQMREARRPVSQVSPGLEKIQKPGAVILSEALLRDATLVERLRTWPKTVPLILVSPSWKSKAILDQIAMLSKGQQTLPLSTFAAVITSEATYTAKNIFSHNPSFNIDNARDIIEAAEFVTERKVVAYAVENGLRDAYEEALPNGFKIVYEFSEGGTGKATLGAGAFNELLHYLVLPEDQQKTEALRGTILIQPVRAEALGSIGEYFLEFDEAVRRL